MRHIPIEPRSLVATLANIPYKAYCGEQRTTPGMGSFCPICTNEISKKAKHFFDLNLEDVNKEDNYRSSIFTPDQAVKEAERLANRDGFLSQDDYQAILGKLDGKYHYPFRMNLLGHSIHIRTGAVNIVDRPEPVVDGHGDAGTVNPTSLWTVAPNMPRPEMNNDPMGTTELDFGKRRRTEGSAVFCEHANENPSHCPCDENCYCKSRTCKQEIGAEIGNNLTDLTIASLQEETRDLVGQLISQQHRMHTYANLIGEIWLRHRLKDLGTMRGYTGLTVAMKHGISDWQVDAPVELPNDLRLIYAELWRHEEDLLPGLAKAGLKNDTLLLKLAQETLPNASEPFPSNAKQWEESYSNENAFEDLDKMGSCDSCYEPLTMLFSCPVCQTHNAMQKKAICYNCNGSGCVCVCKCGAFYNVEIRDVRTASWTKKSDAVKRVTRFADIPIHIEYEAGDIKRYSDGNSRQYNSSYGFIPGTVGADNEPLDVFVGGYPAHRAYVVNQMKPNGNFDEEKVL